MLNEFLPLHHAFVWIDELQCIQAEQLLLDLFANL